MFSIVTISALAQMPPPTTPVPEAMKALAPMIGKWEGSGWMKMGPGEPTTSVGQETVESKLDGRVLIIEGKHWNSDRTRLVHHAFATLQWNESAKEYRFRSTLANGLGGDYRGWMDGKTFIWEMETPRGKMRYFIDISATEWNEVGKIEINGEWKQFFEMKLKRVQ
jgi:hypothetical protein